MLAMMKSPARSVDFGAGYRAAAAGRLRRRRVSNAAANAARLRSTAMPLSRIAASKCRALDRHRAGARQRAEHHRADRHARVPGERIHVEEHRALRALRRAGPPARPDRAGRRPSPSSPGSGRRGASTRSAPCDRASKIRAGPRARLPTSSLASTTSIWPAHRRQREHRRTALARRVAAIST